jgi:hypothetical protein
MDCECISHHLANTVHMHDCPLSQTYANDEYQIPAFPKGVERIRFRFSYQPEGSSSRRTQFFTPRSDEAVINRTGAELNFTLTFLEKDRGYSIRIRAEARYQRRPFLCFRSLIGNYSDAVVFKTNDTCKFDASSVKPCVCSLKWSEF